MTGRLSQRTTRAIGLAFVVLVAGTTLWERFAAPAATPAARATGTTTAPAAQGTTRADNASLLAAVRAKATDRSVSAGGRVIRILADDNEGSRHQRFIISVGRDLTVLIVHNLDLAPRVPLAVGDSVALLGDYVWNDRGGLIHWTHHDPAGRHVPGWIAHAGRRYQ
ncbi:MAG: DUF3465 domain-containing protein [Gemmatimonadota bacterium]|nr:DUF3465 domain-containing protein [Gemmatimonadota bacterium]